MTFCGVIDKDKDNNVHRLLASLPASEIASRDTNPLGPEAVAAQVGYYTLAPQLSRGKD